MLRSINGASFLFHPHHHRIMIAIIKIRREVIRAIQFRLMDNIVDSQQMLEVLESIHIPMPAPLKTILQLITFYSVINIRRRQRFKVTAD